MPDERLDNGLRASVYVPLTDVDPDLGRHLLSALGRARIPAYLAPADDQHQRLFVASEERTDARTIVAAAVRALGADEPQIAEQNDPLAGIDTDAAFDALVAGWYVDTHTAIRNAERDLTREDAEWRNRLAQPAAEPDTVWLDDDHYIPPPPPPLPRLSFAAILGLAVLAVSILVLSLGTEIGLADGFTLVLGISGLIGGVAILLTRVREHSRDEDDDGSAV